MVFTETPKLTVLELYSKLSLNPRIKDQWSMLAWVSKELTTKPF